MSSSIRGFVFKLIINCNCSCTAVSSLNNFFKHYRTINELIKLFTNNSMTLCFTENSNHALFSSLTLAINRLATKSDAK